MVARLAASRFDLSKGKIQSGWDADWKLLRTTLPQHYLFDALQANWRGAGDTRLFNMTWEGESKKLKPSGAYLRKISRKEWEDQLALLVRGPDKAFSTSSLSDSVA